uniref:Uncharacterized protein n=1 Tax=Arundo donax TaxID=35708 RepID=A0A0A9GTA1_ARUDO
MFTKNHNNILLLILWSCIVIAFPFYRIRSATTDTHIFVPFENLIIKLVSITTSLHCSVVVN